MLTLASVSYWAEISGHHCFFFLISNLKSHISMCKNRTTTRSLVTNISENKHESLLRETSAVPSLHLTSKCLEYCDCFWNYRASWSLIKVNCSPVCYDQAWQIAWLRIFTFTPPHRWVWMNTSVGAAKRDCRTGLMWNLSIMFWSLYSWEVLMINCWKAT